MGNTLTNDFEKMASRTDYLLSRWGSWSRPESRVYSYNIDPTSFQSSYSSSSARSARASSVAVGSEMSSSRQMRATTVAPAANPLEGYSGIYGKQLSNLQGRSVSTQQTSAKVSSVSTSTSVKTEQKMERSEKVEKSKVDMIKEHQKSLEYGKTPGVLHSEEQRFTLPTVARIPDMCWCQEITMTTSAKRSQIFICTTPVPCQMQEELKWKNWRRN